MGSEKDHRHTTREWSGSGGPISFFSRRMRRHSAPPSQPHSSRRVKKCKKESATPPCRNAPPLHAEEQLPRRARSSAPATRSTVTATGATAATTTPTTTTAAASTRKAPPVKLPLSRGAPAGKVAPAGATAPPAPPAASAPATAAPKTAGATRAAARDGRRGVTFASSTDFNLWGQHDEQPALRRDADVTIDDDDVDFFNDDDDDEYELDHYLEAEGVSPTRPRAVPAMRSQSLPPSVANTEDDEDAARTAADTCEPPVGRRLVRAGAFKSRRSALKTDLHHAISPSATRPGNISPAARAYMAKGRAAKNATAAARAGSALSMSMENVKPLHRCDAMSPRMPSNKRDEASEDSDSFADCDWRHPAAVRNRSLSAQSTLGSALTTAAVAALGDERPITLHHDGADDDQKNKKRGEKAAGGGAAGAPAIDSNVLDERYLLETSAANFAAMEARAGGGAKPKGRSSFASSSLLPPRHGSAKRVSFATHKNNEAPLSPTQQQRRQRQSLDMESGMTDLFSADYYGLLFDASPKESSMPAGRGGGGGTAAAPLCGTSVKQLSEREEKRRKEKENEREGAGGGADAAPSSPLSPSPSRAAAGVELPSMLATLLPGLDSLLDPPNPPPSAGGKGGELQGGAAAVPPSSAAGKTAAQQQQQQQQQQQGHRKGAAPAPLANAVVHSTSWTARPTAAVATSAAEVERKRGKEKTPGSGGGGGSDAAPVKKAAEAEENEKEESHLPLRRQPSMALAPQLRAARGRPPPPEPLQKSASLETLIGESSSTPQASTPQPATPRLPPRPPSTASPTLTATLSPSLAAVAAAAAAASGSRLSSLSSTSSAPMNAGPPAATALAAQTTCGGATVVAASPSTVAAAVRRFNEAGGAAMPTPPLSPPLTTGPRSRTSSNLPTPVHLPLLTAAVPSPSPSASPAANVAAAPLSGQAARRLSGVNAAVPGARADSPAAAAHAGSGNVSDGVAHGTSPAGRTILPLLGNDDGGERRNAAAIGRAATVADASSMHGSGSGKGSLLRAAPQQAQRHELRSAAAGPSETVLVISAPPHPTIHLPRGTAMAALARAPSPRSGNNSGDARVPQQTGSRVGALMPLAGAAQSSALAMSLVSADFDVGQTPYSF